MDEKGDSNESSRPDEAESFVVRVVCPKCGKTYKNKSNLKIHMLTHSGVKPFRCRVAPCSQGFTTKQCLQLHYKRHHGFRRENMPKITRKIPYTIAAYSGGIIQNNDKIERKKVSNAQDELDGEDREESPIDPNMFLEEMNVESPESPPPLLIDCDRAFSPQPNSSSAVRASEQNPLCVISGEERYY